MPYVERPPEVTPGVSRFYATAALRAGLAVGLLGASREGRPIKLEGNPGHPSSLGATGAPEQALSYTLYDTDRLNGILQNGAASSFDAFRRAVAPSDDGRGLHLWLPATSSPLVAGLLADLQERLPRARVSFDSADVPQSEWAATREVFGRVLTPQYRFDLADRVLALDADFLTDQPASIRWAHDWAGRRNPAETMSRCYAVDSTPTSTSVSFDHRLVVRSSEIGRIAAGVLGALDPAHRGWLEQAPHRRWVETVARDLASHRSRSVVVAGARQPPHVHVIALAINAALDSFEHTLRFTPSPWLQAGEAAFDSRGLMDALEAGEVETLAVLGGNPAYGVLGFEERAKRARSRIVLAEFPNETARLASWLLPALHPLERWGDARGHDGAWTLIQPLIRPLFGGHALERVLLALAGEPDEEPRTLLERSLQEAGHDTRAALGEGFVEGTAFVSERVEPSVDASAALRALARSQPTEGFELELRRDPHIGDGAQAENAWLQELPETMTKIVWGNAALMAPVDAAELGLAQGDVIEVRAGEGAVRLPVMPVEGQAAGTIVAWRGYGRREGGRTARNVGVDVGTLGASPWIGASVRATGQHVELARTQHKFEPTPEETAVVLRATLERFEQDPEFAQPHDETPPSLHPDRLHGSPQWGMAIDLGLCTGCQACVIACQVENNVPVVGKTQVALGREMHWLRIDRYTDQRGGETLTTFQPMLCVHCEKAPCEYVCPVNATVHSPDGLNEMVYNRCVGTRFCSNNCPYKVRRFNWYDYHVDAREPETMVFNPDVTVRRRGVMEKCTYCVQRIRRAQIDARRERRELGDGDVVTACAQACPTSAIVFGDVSDANARVSRLHADPRTYAVLNHLGTRPRTRHMARIDNVNPELEGG